MALGEDWFTEVCEEGGSAFSLKLGEKIHEEQSAFQRIEVYQTERFGRLLVIDGFVMLSERDNFIYHEMMSHPALFTHPAPRRVAIIGGGDCGTLREVLKHPQVERVTQVDIDERVTRVAEQYFPELCQSNADPRAELLFADGIEWISRAGPDSLDVIIVDSTDPIGPAEGLFRAPFFRDCLRALGNEGVFVQQSESPLYHLQLMRSMGQALREAGFASVRPLLFPQSVYPSGWWSATLARASGEVARFREADAGALAFGTHYYTAQVHHAALAPPAFLARALGLQA